MAVNDHIMAVPCPRCGIRVNVLVKVQGVMLGKIGDTDTPGMAVHFAEGGQAHTCPED